MFPPFPEEDAFSICKLIISSLADGTLVLEQISRVSEERANHGVMIGALVAKKSDGQLLNLVTTSGISKSLHPVAGKAFDNSFVFVGPLVDAKKIEDALAKNDEMIHTLTRQIEELKSNQTQTSDTNNNLENLVHQRTLLTTESLNSVFALYSFHVVGNSTAGDTTATVKTLKEICIERNKGRLPPTGTGDCCAPKLLDYAFAHNLSPVSMCEVFYGTSAPQKINGQKYAPCDERCGIILPAMLGLEILYRDEHIIVVNKQSGVLSVPGRGPDKQDCIVNRVRTLFPNCIKQPSVHRLDMETSGILVLAFTEEAHRNLSKQFEAGEINKRYIALIDDDLLKRNIPQHGESRLYFRLDVDNRPHQIWDEVYGKEAITEWQINNTELYTGPSGRKRKVTRITFMPHTGRTHQLRLASSDPHGFGAPIVGDTLYGHCDEGERLMLHAEYLSFTHPVTGQKMEFFCKSAF
jgi:tRNA pseudouridine32 synthase/23S rRNA pseudouridine746 synthase